MELLSRSGASFHRRAAAAKVHTCRDPFFLVVRSIDVLGGEAGWTALVTEQQLLRCTPAAILFPFPWVVRSIGVGNIHNCRDPFFLAVRSTDVPGGEAGWTALVTEQRLLRSTPAAILSSGRCAVPTCREGKLAGQRW